MEAVSPFAPPRDSDDLLPAGGVVGAEPEDFRVDEIPAYLPCGEGDHLYVRIRKRRMTTAAAIRLLARAAGVEMRDVGSAGMKDRNAVTTQWISLPPGASDPAGWSLPDDLRVEEVSRHRNKLRTGHLLGNRFQIRLIDAEPEPLDAALQRVVHAGVTNYFGPQRFGHGGRNLARALAWLDPGQRVRIDRLERKLLPSVLQSEYFNRWAAARRAFGLDRVMSGEWVRLAGAGKGFVVDDVDDGTRRLREGDVVLTGPLPGGRVREGEGEASELATRIWDEMAVSGPVRDTLDREVPGTRRDLVIHPGDLTLERADDGAHILAFSLPAGAYASMVVREITGRPWETAMREGWSDGE